MDTSKEYILMCEKAEEIQREWKPQKMDLTFKTMYINEVDIEKFIRFVWWDFEKEDNIFLPRQDQLQAMLSNQLQDLLDDICTSDIGYKFMHKYELNSMEQLWLAFVMKEKYQKTWNEKEWNKEQ